MFASFAFGLKGFIFLIFEARKSIIIFSLKKQWFLFFMLYLACFWAINPDVNAQGDTTLPVIDTVFIQPDSMANIRTDSANMRSVPVALDADTTRLEPDSLQAAKKTRPTASEIVDSLSVTYFRGSTDNMKLHLYQYIDTSTYKFQQFNPLKRNNGMYSTLSNIGLAHNNLVFTPRLSVDYYFENRHFDKYIYENQNVKYYDLYMPYTEATYVFGAQKEQNFQIIFTREIIKRLTIGLDFVINNSPGPYLNSKADDKRAFFTGQYYTKNRRYGIIANYLYNKLIIQENGGIIYDSIFEDNLQSNRRIIPVHLTKSQNRIKQSGFFVEQYFNFLKPKPDSVQRKLDAGSISWSIHYQRNQMIYESTDTAKIFYQPYALPLNPEMTFDSIYQMRLRNKFQWSSIGYHDNPFHQVFNARFGIVYDYVLQTFPDYRDDDSFIYNQLTRLTYSQLKPYGAISINIKKSFRLSGYAELVLGGYNSGDLKIEGIIDQYLGNVNRNVGKIHAGIKFVNKTPEWFYQRYQSNFYRWNNNFNKETHLLIFGEYQFKHLKGGAKFYTFGNYTYLDDSIRPAQISEAATMLQLYIEGLATIKKFGINTKLVYQKTSRQDIIRVPEFSGVIDLFYRSPVFKRAATLQAGFELSYFSSYYADSYMPALRDWYLQNSQKIGNYLFADVYVTLKVQDARIFIKYAHFNSSFSGFNYYLAPAYPARDARFYLGVSWRFYN